MKKHVFFGTLLACLFAFSACETEEIVNVITEGLYGNASITITDANGVTKDLDYQSSITDVFADTASVNPLVIRRVGTLDFSFNVDLTQANAEMDFPLMGFQVKDTNAGVYPVDQVLTKELLQNNFCWDTLAKILRDPAGLNIVAIAASDTSWYISHTGSINITEFPKVGKLVKGSFNNIGGYYLTKTKADALADALDNGADFDLDAYFEPVTITGTFNSRRAEIIKTLIRKAFYEGGLCNLNN